MLAFLLTDDENFTVDEAAAAKNLGADGQQVLQAAVDALVGAPAWTTSAIEQVLRESLIEERGLKPRLAFGPLRVATTGRAVSPPLFESLELLGRERSLRRLNAARRDG